MEYSSMAKSLTWSQCKKACFSVTEDKGRKVHEQAAISGDCIKDLVKHLKEENPVLGDVHGLQT